MPGTASRGVCANLRVPCALLKEDTPPGGADQWSLVAGLQVVAEKLSITPLGDAAITNYHGNGD